jgi:hypothetical protein
MSDPDHNIARARLLVLRYGFDQLNAAYRALSPGVRDSSVTEFLDALAHLQTDVERDPYSFGLPINWQKVGDAVEGFSKTMWGREFASINTVMGDYVRRRR